MLEATAGSPRRPARPMSRASSSLGAVAHRFDVVPVRISDKSTEIVFVVLRPDPGLVQNFSTSAYGCVEECSYSYPVACCKGDVRLPEAVAGLLLTNPEI